MGLEQDLKGCCDVDQQSINKRSTKTKSLSRDYTYLDVLQSHGIVQVLDSDLGIALVAGCPSVASVVVVVAAVVASCPS